MLWRFTYSSIKEVLSNGGSISINDLASRLSLSEHLSFYGETVELVGHLLYLVECLDFDGHLVTYVPKESYSSCSNVPNVLEKLRVQGFRV